MGADQSRFCKAYLVRDFKNFESWHDSLIRKQLVLDDDSILYLHNDYVVRDGIFAEDKVVFDAIDQNWKDYCHSQITFEVPQVQAVSSPDRSVGVSG